MKNKTINLFGDELDKDLNEDKAINRLVDALMEENKTKEDQNLDKLLHESGSLDEPINPASNIKSDKELAKDNKYVLDSNEWHTVGKA
jgi:hypothetical protein